MVHANAHGEQDRENEGGGMLLAHARPSPPNTTNTTIGSRCVTLFLFAVPPFIWFYFGAPVQICFSVQSLPGRKYHMVATMAHRFLTLKVRKYEECAVDGR